MLRGGFEPLVYQVDIRFSGAYAAGRLFLKAVQYVHSLGKAYGVDSAVGVAVIGLYHLQHASTLALPRLGSGMLCTQLRYAKGIAYCASRLAAPVHSKGFSSSMGYFIYKSVCVVEVWWFSVVDVVQVLTGRIKPGFNNHTAMACNALSDNAAWLAMDLSAI
jgi:hypothetical protein